LAIQAKNSFLPEKYAGNRRMGKLVKYCNFNGNQDDSEHRPFFSLPSAKAFLFQTH